MVLCDFSETACLAKIWFSRYSPKGPKALGQSDRSILEIMISREPFILKISKNSKKSKKNIMKPFLPKSAPNLFKKG